MFSHPRILLYLRHNVVKTFLELIFEINFLHKNLNFKISMDENGFCSIVNNQLKSHSFVKQRFFSL